MDLEGFLKHLDSGRPVGGGSETHLFMHGVSQEALKITAQINGSYHEPQELRALFSRLTGRPGGRELRLVSALLHGLREEHPCGEKRIHQHGM